MNALTTIASTPHRGAALVILIGVFKLAKAALLATMAFLTLKLIHKDIAQVLETTAHHLHIAPGNRHLQSLMEKSLSITKRKLELAAVVLMLYSATFTVEGVGLVLRKRWAEWMTVITTAGLIPIELYEIVEKPSPLKFGALVVNIAIAVYLAHRAWRETHAPAAGSQTSAKE